MCYILCLTDYIPTIYSAYTNCVYPRHNLANCKRIRHNSVQSVNMDTWKHTIILQYYSMFWYDVSGTATVLFHNTADIQMKVMFYVEKFVGLEVLRTILSQNRPVWSDFRVYLGVSRSKNRLVDTIVQYAQRGDRVCIRQYVENIGWFLCNMTKEKCV